MSNPTNLKYTKDHEWVKVEGDICVMGITDHAQESMGDVVFIEVLGDGQSVAKGKSYGTIESVKAVSEVMSCVNGTIVEVNQTILDAPETLNSDPYNEGWLIKVATEDLSMLDELMNAEEYDEYLSQI